MIRKGYPRLQPPGHAGAVHPVQQSLHKPAQIEIAHLPPAPGLRLFLRQQGNLSQGIMPDILAFYESEEGQREFAEWKKQREAERQKAETKK